MKNPLASQGGFTLIEMVTIIVMISILSMIILANTQTGNRRQQLRDAAEDYVSAAKHAESLASGSQAVADPDLGGQKTSRKAYGVCITSSQIANSKCANPSGQTADTYQVYARDLDETALSVEASLTSPPTEPEIISTFKLPQDYSFLITDVWLDYVPPTPAMFVNGLSSNRQVIIAYKDLTLTECAGNRDCRYIQVKPLAGAVYVQ